MATISTGNLQAHVSTYMMVVQDTERMYIHVLYIMAMQGTDSA